MMNNEKNRMPEELNDNVLDGITGGTRTNYGNVPNKRVADLKCAVCGCHIVFSNKNSFKTVGGKVLCNRCGG